MVIKNEESERPFPVIKAWDSNLLNEREKLEFKLSGFGKGYMRGIAKIEKQPQVHTNRDDLNRKDVGEDEGSLLGFLENYFSEGRNLALTMKKFMKSMKSAPSQLSNNGLFNKANEAIQRMLNLKVNEASQKLPTAEEYENLLQQEFWAAAERCIEEVGRTIEERER